jgi:peroxiredoxin
LSLLSILILTTGLWRAALMTPGGELPFGLEINSSGKSYTFTIINGAERMLMDNVTVKDDSLIVRFPVYESELRLKVVDANHLSGTFINLTRATHHTIPLEARAGNTPRFATAQGNSKANVSGRWSVQFSPGAKDSTYAVGLFEQREGRVTGTFLTTSGDYRYLEGAVSGDSLFLSTFDGVFVYLFKARISGNALEGMFYSGTHRQVPFTGYLDERARLPDPASLTRYDTEKYPLAFRLPDTDSNLVSLDDERFKGKVVLLQIMGSWCPNCLDESEFLAPWYDKNKHRGVEIIGLSFEKTDDFVRASGNVKRFMQRLRINYPVLVAANRDKLKTILPGLENFAGYPTTIYLDKQRRIRKIHAGFSGAATGAEYEKFKDDFVLFMDKLLNE